MRTQVNIQAGVCGFRTSANVLCEDAQHVAFAIESDCAKIAEVGRQLAQQGSLDAYREIDSRTGSALLATTSQILTGCCAGCAVPVGLFKAMQVAAGLALPKDIAIQLETIDD